MSYQKYLGEIRRLAGVTHYEARLTWQRLRPWLELNDRVSAAAIRRHSSKVREFAALARGYVPPGWLVEVSLKTRGGTARHKGDRRSGAQRRRDARPLYVKIGVRSRQALPILEHERALRRTIERGAVPDDFQLTYVDWEKGEGFRMNAGSISPRRAAELVAFYGALHHPRTEIRVEMVNEEE